MGEDFSIAPKPVDWFVGGDPDEMQVRHDDRLLGFDPLGEYGGEALPEEERTTGLKGGKARPTWKAPSKGGSRPERRPEPERTPPRSGTSAG